MERFQRISQWVRTNKWTWVLLAIVLVGVLAGLMTYKQEVTEADLLESIKQTAVAKSYRFTAKAVMQVGVNDRILSEVTGEKEGQKFHMQGEMLKTPVEAYLMQGKLYIKNPWGKWLVLDETDEEQAQLYISELNPLGLLNIKDVAKLTDVREELVNDEQLYRFTIKPDIEQQVLEMMWTDFTATLWVEPRSQKVRLARVVAKSKSKPQDRLSVNIKFWDFNRSFGLEPPVKANN